MKYYLFLFTIILSPISALSSYAEEIEIARNQKLLADAKKVIILGDSITYAGHYVVNFETWLAAKYPQKKYSLINLGLGSETISGLSEKRHAGGRFPRPDLHERLERVLTKTKPDLIFACYGMNCGIYQKLDKQRFKSYQEGAVKLKKKAAAINAKIIFITPPYFDNKVNKTKSYYTNLLREYSKWLISQRKNGWNVIDLNSHMENAVNKQRKSKPNFTYQKDAVHPNPAGHWVMTQPLISWFGDKKSASSTNTLKMLESLKLNTNAKKLHKLIQKRSHILRDTWLATTGHKRPGVKRGMPIDQSEKVTNTLTQEIDSIRRSIK